MTKTRAGWAGMGLGTRASVTTLTAGQNDGHGPRASADVHPAAERSHQHHRQHAGRADAVRRLAGDDAPGAVPEASAGRPQPRVQRRRDRHAPPLEELRHARRVAERPGPARSAATRTTGSPEPRRRPTSSSRSSATTSPTPGRPVSRRSRRSWATGSRTRWRRSTTDKSAPRIVLFSPIAHEDLGNPDLPDGKENNQRLALYTKAMADVARARERHVRRSVRAEPKLYADMQGAAHDPGHPPQREGNRQIAQVIDRDAVRRRRRSIRRRC